MKISVILRTRDEEANIEHFCSSYAWADRILIADGGSQDDTVSKALQFPNVSVRNFDRHILMKHKMTRNPHGEHLNFLIDWAFQEEQSDWVICDDADCFPNYMVKEHARRVMEETKRKFVFITRLYLYKDLGHFPKMAQPVKRNRWEPGLWAWHKDSGFRFREDTEPHEHQQMNRIPAHEEIVKLMPPYCLLHCPWPNDEVIEDKLNFYRRSGEVPNMKHPLHMDGNELMPLPEWAVE